MGMGMRVESDGLVCDNGKNGNEHQNKLDFKF